MIVRKKTKVKLNIFELHKTGIAESRFKYVFTVKNAVFKNALSFTRYGVFKNLLQRGAYKYYFNNHKFFHYI